MAWSTDGAVFVIAINTFIGSLNYCFFVHLQPHHLEPALGTVVAAALTLLWTLSISAGFVNYWMAVLTRPGHVEPGCVLEDGVPLEHCKKCNLERPALLRPHHCSRCGCCVLRMDHHCFWMDTCVGQRNYFFFLLQEIWFLVASCAFTIGTIVPLRRLCTMHTGLEHHNERRAAPVSL